MLKNCNLFILSVSLLVVTLSFLEESSAEPRRRSRTRYRTIHRAIDDDDEEVSYPSNAKWISKDEVEIKRNMITCRIDTSENKNEKCNGMWQQGDGFNSGEHYWKIYFIEVGEKGAFVGLTNATRFKTTKSKIAGLLYGNLNLGNGRDNDNLVREYGRWFKSGDEVGILASFTESRNKLRVYYFINDRPLGLAYNVDKNVLPNIQPMVQFRDSGITTITKKAEREIPTKRERESPQEDGFEGYWRIDKSKKVLFDGKEFKLSNLPQDEDGYNPNIVTIEIHSLGEAYIVYVRIINNNVFKFSMKKDKDESLGTWKASNPKELEPAEYPIRDKYVKQLWDKLFAMAKGGKLKSSTPGVLTFTQGENVNKVTFGRWKRKPEKYEKNPFSKSEKPEDPCSCPCQNLGWKPPTDKEEDD